jgi:hypothetical protein
MMCAVAVRQIKSGSYDQFRKAWQHDPWLPRYEKALVLRNEESADQVLTIAFFDGTQEEYETARDEPETMAAEERRLHRIAELEERVLLSGVYELVEEVLPPDDHADHDR